MNLPREKVLRMAKMARTSPHLEAEIEGLRRHLNSGQLHLDNLRNKFGIDARTAGIMIMQRNKNEQQKATAR